MMQNAASIFAVPNIPDIREGDDLARIIGDCLEDQDIPLADGDILCIAHKIFSKAEGNTYWLKDVEASAEAAQLGEELNKDPRKVEIILNQSVRIVRKFKRPDQNQGTLICEHKLGFISANAAVDESNAEEADSVITLPDDPDKSANQLRLALEVRFGVSLGVVMTDTFGRPWRLGQVNVAIGLSQVPAKVSEIGNTDAWGRPLSVTEPAFADEIAAASGLVIRKAAKTPVVIFRGLEWTPDQHASASDILRTPEKDMFR